MTKLLGIAMAGFLFLMMLPSCLKQESAYESLPSVQVSDTCLALPFGYGTDTIQVTANRGWTVIADTTCQWLNVTPKEVMNLGSSSITTNLVVRFYRNISYEGRQTSFSISGDGFVRTIKAVQSPADSTSEISGVEGFTDLDTLNFGNQ